MSIYKCSAHFGVYVEAESPEKAREIIKKSIEYALQFAYTSEIISYIDPLHPNAIVEVTMTE